MLKSSRLPSDMAPGWTPGTARDFRRCVRPSYRLDLMSAGQPVLLWISGPHRPGVHALGRLAGQADTDGDTWEVPVRLTLLAEPVGRAELLADPVARTAEVLRMPAGSNPSWLSPDQFATVLARLRNDGLGPWPA